MYRVVSLFSGCGGLDLGFRDAGFEIVYACDHDRAAVDCYARNVGRHVHERDVRSAAFRRDIDVIADCDIVLGGFPCQGFSKAGPKRHDDERNGLYREMRTTVRRLRPHLFIAENVDGMRQNFAGAYVRRIIADFSTIGYHVEYKVLDAAAFGLSQHRRRIFFVGIRRGSRVRFGWPSPTHRVRSRNGEWPLPHERDIPHQGQLFDNTPQANDHSPVRTIRHAIGDLIGLRASPSDHEIVPTWPEEYNLIFKRIGPGQKLCNVRNASTSVKTWDIPEAFGDVSDRQVRILETIARHRRHRRYGGRPNGNPLPRSEILRLTGFAQVDQDIAELLAKRYLKEVTPESYDLRGALFCSGIFKRPLWDRPSPTVLTNFHNPRYFLHPERDRPFSLRECARLQGFPDSFEFQSDDVTLVDGYRLVGNAVPPPIGSLLAAASRRALSDSRRSVYAAGRA